MLRRSLTIGALLVAGLVTFAGLAVAASGQVAIPLAHRLQSILVDLHRPAFLLGTKKVSRGFVVAADGLVVAPASGLGQAGLGSEVKLEWTDRPWYGRRRDRGRQLTPATCLQQIYRKNRYADEIIRRR